MKSYRKHNENHMCFGIQESAPSPKVGTQGTPDNMPLAIVILEVASCWLLIAPSEIPWPPASQALDRLTFSLSQKCNTYHAIIVWSRYFSSLWLIRKNVISPSVSQKHMPPSSWSFVLWSKCPVKDFISQNRTLGKAGGISMPWISRVEMREAKLPFSALKKRGTNGKSPTENCHRPFTFNYTPRLSFI